MFYFEGCKLSYVRLWISVFVLSEIIPNTGSQCAIRNGDCTYNVYLNNGNGDCDLSHPGVRENVVLGRSDIRSEQNDNSHSSASEPNNHLIPNNHEGRIRELEASVQKLLRDAVHPVSPNSIPEGPANPMGNLGNRRNQSEGNLLSRLANEFANLRNDLRTKTLALLDRETKLNESMAALETAQENLFETSEQLVIAEHRAATLQQEGYILKNQIKHKTSKLATATEKLNISETKLRAMENQLYVLVRSEANLKEELGYYRYKLNQTERKLDTLKRNHTRLRHHFNRTVRNLRKTQSDLMDCYSAKTQTFCGFEDDELCGFTQENETDDFDWTLARIKTPSAQTGPTGDHTCGPGTRGRFMYIEASAKKSDLSAVLKSVKYRGLDRQCAQFHYHMYGRNTGTLNVYTKTESSEDALSTWRTYGDQGDVWILASLAIPRELARIGYQIVFEGITGRGYRGDIAIDDIKVKDGSCPSGGVVIPVRFDPSTLQTTNSTTEDDDSKRRQFRKFRRIFRNRVRRPPAAS